MVNWFHPLKKVVNHGFLVTNRVLNWNLAGETDCIDSRKVEY